MTKGVFGGLVGLLAVAAVAAARAPLPGWQFEERIRGIEVRDTTGQSVMEPFLGGFNLPRPQLIDVDGDGDLDLFVQENKDALIFFERVGEQWIWRQDAYQNLKVGQWFRFADLNKDGLVDLLAEEPFGYIRVYQNVGSSSAPRFQLAIDSLRDTEGKPIFADPQNILNVVDIDNNGRLDLFIGRVMGTIDRFEEDGIDAKGFPRFRMLMEQWEGIEIVGAASGAPPSTIIDSLASEGMALRQATARHGANTMAFGDIDHDGDLDLFWGDFFEAGLLLIENHGTPSTPNLRGDPVRFPRGAAVTTSGYNAPTTGDIDGDGTLDVVMGVIGGAFQPERTSTENLWLIGQTTPGNIVAKSRRLISMIDVGSEALPQLVDYDGDGDLDLLIGNKASPSNSTTGTLTLFENIGTAKAPVFRDRGPIPGIRGNFGFAPALADIDGDGLPELILGTWSDKLQRWQNTGSRAQPRWVLTDTAFVTITRGSNTYPTFGDIDGDGLLDLVIGEASGTLNVYLNKGTKTQPHFTLVSDEFQAIDVGRRSAPTLQDVNGDGKLDLLVGNEDGLLQLYLNSSTPSQPKFVLDPSFPLKSRAENATPTAGDLDSDGRLDLLVGTVSGGVRWYINTGHP